MWILSWETKDGFTIEVTPGAYHVVREMRFCAEITLLQGKTKASWSKQEGAYIWLEDKEFFMKRCSWSWTWPRGRLFNIIPSASIYWIIIMVFQVRRNAMI